MQFAKFINEVSTANRSLRSRLVRSWTDAEVSRVTNAFKRAFCKSSFEVVSATTNQSMGNKIEAALIQGLSTGGANLGLKKASGKGYPDAIADIKGVGTILVEIKATSKWDATDSNRRVIFSSTKKLEKLVFDDEVLPLHLLLSCDYLFELKKRTGRITALRLFFIDPEVNISRRLEASTSHKALNKLNASRRAVISLSR